MNRFQLIARMVVLAGLLTAVRTSRAGTLEEQFRSPPDSARPHTWWHWMNGNVSRDGITKDLEAMKRVGLGGFQAFHVTDGIPHGPVDYMSDRWLDLMQHAAKQADRLGLEMCMHNCAGWSSSGGPWISPEQSMQEVVYSETRISGGKTLDLVLPRPEARNDFYRDIAVLAFPTLKGDADGKEGFRLADWGWKINRNIAGRKPDSRITRDVRTPPAGDIISLDHVILLTSKMDRAGKLTWVAPAGEWTILRFGHTTTGRTNKPAPPEGLGLECNKLDRAAVKHHWDHSVARVIERAGPLTGKVFNHVLIDSYEVGFQNWTDGLDKTFAQRLGYDLHPYLPCLTGRVVENVDTTERFLWDYRRLIADLMAENYFGYFRELCHAHGMKLSIEPYGPGGFDDFQVATIADIPMGEFWVDRADAWHQWSVKVAASAAHASGNQFVGAESFTAAPPGSSFAKHPYLLQPLADEFFAQGLNHIIFHTNVHQPWGDNVLPGMTMGPHGIQMNRNNTWHAQARPWIDALSRAQFMLQQGRPAVELCYLAAEDAPQTPLNRDALKPAPPPFYDYDMLYYGTVMQMSVKDRRLVLPSGMSYRVLLLPDTDRMRLELLEKLVTLAKDGALLFAPRRIVSSPSLHHQPGDDQKVAGLAQQLSQYARFDQPLAGVLEAAGELPAFTCDQPQIVWNHRQLDNADVFFIANRAAREVTLNAKFRALGDAELWHIVDGTIERFSNPQRDGGQTTLALRLDPVESLFVVFREKSGAPIVETFVHSKEIALPGPWSVAFPKGWGAPERLDLPKLISWTEHDDDQVKHFSGTATYRTSFSVPELIAEHRARLDLGDVQVMARVKLNGKDLGLLWKPPFRVNLPPGILLGGDNELEVAVTNLWVNRLIGDETYPPLGNYKPDRRRGAGITELPQWLLSGESKPQTKRKTFTTFRHYKADDPLLPSGLIGPVKIELSSGL